MKITIYTITDCQFSKQEKEYLQQHNLPYEEKNLEQNREWLTEMLAVSNNFAGTPVTKIEKDDGQISVLKGFTKEEFDQVLGIKEDVAQANTQVNPPPQPQPQPPENPLPQPPQVSEVNQPPPTQPPPAPAEQTSSSAPEPSDDVLNAVLTNLQEKANGQISQQPANNPSTPQAPTSGPTPNIPDFHDKI